MVGVSKSGAVAVSAAVRRPRQRANRTRSPKHLFGGSGLSRARWAGDVRSTRESLAVLVVGRCVIQLATPVRSLEPKDRSKLMPNVDSIFGVQPETVAWSGVESFVELVEVGGLNSLARWRGNQSLG